MSQQQSTHEKLQQIQARIHTAEAAAGRDKGSVRLIGASKKQSPELVVEFAQAGLSQLGENYVQEAMAKQNAIAKIDAGQSDNLVWHFIGQIQSNKTKFIAQNFEWVHGVDRVKIARRLAEQNTKSRSLKLLIQLNLDDEISKSGIGLKQASELANDITQILANDEKGELKGFMAIPKPRQNQQEQRAFFASVQELLIQTNQRYGLSLDQLSMGMSGDLESAIAEGATMVRIGTDLFGVRK